MNTRRKCLITAGLRRPWRVPKYLTSLAIGRIKAGWHAHRADSWEDYYTRTTKTNRDPRALIGDADQFDELREWQMDLLRSQGLQPSETLVDFGCGVLRAGIPLIKHLDAGNYYGIDISQRALLDGHRRIHDHGLGARLPTLIQNSDLEFRELDGLGADWLLAQSVWTHLPPDRLTTCLQHLPRVLADNGIVIATIYEADGEPTRNDRGARRAVDWQYPVAWISKRLPAAATVERIAADHPNGQAVLRISGLGVS